jgi:hypothetical protein
MAIEKKWATTGPYSVTTPGTSDGVLTLALPVDRYLKLHVKQRIRLSDPVQPTLELEIKRVVAPNIIEVGAIGKPITNRSDVSSYGAASTVFSPEQDRPTIPIQELDRATFEEEPGANRRTMVVDPNGDYTTISNPFPVEVSDGSHQLAINSDGSINANIVISPLPDTYVSVFSDVTLVPSFVPTTVNSYVVPVGKSGSLTKIDVSGTNIALYTIMVNGSTIDQRYTYFGSSLNEHFEFSANGQGGYPITAGDTVVVQVIHVRPTTGDFGARIQALLVG